MRFFLAVLMLAGWGIGQDLPPKDLPKLSDIRIAGTSVMTVSGPMDAPKTILNCDPVLTDKGEWTPHVTNCRLENGASLDDVMNAMVDMQQMERKQWQSDNDDLRAIANKGMSLARESNKNAMQCSKDFKAFIRSAEAYAKGNKQ